MAKIPASERDAFYEARRSELAEVALKLWAEKGFDQTSVEAITREAGVSKGTFYLYFESKQALLEDVMQRNSLAPNVFALVQDLAHEDFETAVHRFVAGAWEHLEAHRELLIVALREIAGHLDEVHQIVERVLAPMNLQLAKYLEQRIDPERSAVLSHLIAARSLVGLVVFMFLSQELLGFGRVLPVPREDITRTIAELFLHGVGPRSTAPSNASDDPAPDPTGDSS